MATNLVTRGNELLEAGRWEEARSVFEEASRYGDVDALFGLATALRWLDDIGAAIGALERAYRRYVETGSDIAAVTTAVSLAELFTDYRGEPAVAGGWLQRARHHLKGDPDNPALVTVGGMEAYLALAYDKDPVRARRLVESAMEHARRLDYRTAELTAKAQLGLILVSQGEVREGMRLLDESTAAATAAELSQEEAANVYCILITACDRVRDFDRVSQWTQRVLAIANETGIASLATFARTQYASVLIWTGKWAEAREQLSSVVEDTERRPLTAAMALVLLASLNRRQGDLEGADEILRRAESEPFRSGVRHMVLTGRAALELDRGDLQTASDMTARYLRAVSTDDPIERVGALEILVRAKAGLGDVEEAGAAAAELSDIATMIGTAAIRGAASAAKGVTSRAAGQTALAGRSFEEAVELFETAGVPHEAIRTRLDLAEVLIEEGRPDTARREAVIARESASRLGARMDVARADTILATLRPTEGTPGGLTDRETDVLRLLAIGKPNSQIGDELFISVRTVERHISNIYTKIGVIGRSGRAAATAFAHRHGIT